MLENVLTLFNSLLCNYFPPSVNCRYRLEFNLNVLQQGSSTSRLVFFSTASSHLSRRTRRSHHQFSGLHPNTVCARLPASTLSVQTTASKLWLFISHFPSVTSPPDSSVKPPGFNPTYFQVSRWEQTRTRTRTPHLHLHPIRLGWRWPRILLKTATESGLALLRWYWAGLPTLSHSLGPSAPSPLKSLDLLPPIKKELGSY